MRGSAIQARSPAWATPGTALPAIQRASLCASRTNSAHLEMGQRIGTGRDGFGAGIPAGASQSDGVAAVVARRIAGSMLREDREGTSSL
jgi:hypothetical protein